MIMQKHLSRMTLREKCAQMVFIDFRFDQPDYDRTMRLVKKEGVGGICLRGGSIFDVTPLVNSYQRVAKYPLLVAASYEDGAGPQVYGATVFPPNLAVGATGSEDLACLKGRQMGLEARILGVPWVLAPVVEVSGSTAAGTRSFGQDPVLVGRLARATLRGLHAAGVLGCAKHFPPASEEPLDRLLETGLLPFREAAPEADAFLLGPAILRALDPDTPGALSRPVVGDFLRGRLGFQGLVAADLSEGGSLAGFCAEPEAVVRAAVAGSDVLLGPGDPDLAIRALEEAVKGGRLPEPAVDAAVDRILEVKEKRGLFRERLTDVRGVESLLRNEAHRQGAQRIADAAVTLVRGSGAVEGAVEILAEGRGPGASPAALFEKELARKVKIEEGAGTLVAVVIPGAAPSGVLEERLREAERGGRRILVVCLGDPRGVRGIPGGAAFVCAYGGDEYCQRAAARALLGEIPFPGRLPVALEA